MRRLLNELVVQWKTTNLRSGALICAVGSRVMEHKKNRKNTAGVPHSRSPHEDV
jgi:hypothetical protein